MVDEGFIVRMVTTDGGFDALAPDWCRLYAITPKVTGFQSIEWLRSCWEHLAPPSSRLYVSVVERDGTAVAIFPTALDATGVLHFLGRESSNYSGPVFDPDFLQQAVEAWSSSLAGDRAVRGLELTGLREDSRFTDRVLRRGIPGWSRDHIVRTNLCPEVDLSRGWESIEGRHKKKTRSTWARKEKRLARLGPLEFEALTEPGPVAEALPEAFAIWEGRFAGKRISGSFTKPRQSFHIAAARAAAAAGAIQLDLLRLDGKVVAFYYGIRNPKWTTSYILAHDDTFAACSPGLLLLLHVLQKAANAGDTQYDFSLGRASYKDMFATYQTTVYSYFTGKHSLRRATWARLWVWGRSVQWLQRLKVEGLRGVLRRSAPTAPRQPDTAPVQPPAKFVYELASTPGEARSVLRPARYGDMTRLLPAHLLQHAVERTFRGDQLLICCNEHGSELGTVWLVAPHRREAVIGERIDETQRSQPVYTELRELAPATRQNLLALLSEHGAGLLASAEPIAAEAVTQVTSRDG